MSARRFLGLWALAVVSAGALWTPGWRAAPLPPLLEPSSIRRWWDAAGPLAATFGVLRGALLAGSVVWIAGLAALSVPRSRRWLVGALAGRRFGSLVLGMAAAAASVSGCASGGSRPVPPPPVLEALGAPHEARAAPAPAPHPPPPAPPPPAPPPPARAWVVRPGDDLWSIAERALAAAGGGAAPTEREVARYWLEVIRANRPHVPDPNLIFPGEVVALPPPSLDYSLRPWGPFVVGAGDAWGLGGPG